MTHPDKEFMCLCRDQPYAFVCQGKLGMPRWSLLLIISTYSIYCVSCYLPGKWSWWGEIRVDN
jgi:hypothetical protein